MEINKIYCGDSLMVLKTLPDESVNCCVTSPPYWGLRDYGIEPVIWDGVEGCEHQWGSDIVKKLTNNNATESSTISKTGYSNKGLERNIEYKTNFCSKCGAWRGSLGLEPTFELYIKHLCDIFDEIKRVLRKDGTCWVNLGDTYNANSGGYSDKWDYGNNAVGARKNRIKIEKEQKSLPTKSLCLIPQRFAIEMVNRGWILRNTIIWKKPNCMPSSANDRFTVDFEYLFFFVKSKKYWFEQAFEEHLSYDKRDITNRQKNYRGKFDKNIAETMNSPRARMNRESYNPESFYNPQGRNKRCVWTIPTHPFPEAHFAVYPEKLIETPIQAGCPRYVCKKCGKARVKILDRSNKVNAQWGERKSNTQGFRDKREMPQKVIKNVNIKELGYTDCGCNTGFEGGVVLDPFSGAGTTAVVAKKQGKNYIGIELKQEYIDMANKRIRAVRELLF